MKKNDIRDLKTKSVDELRRMVSDIKSELGIVSINKTLKKVKNTNELKNKKVAIARILTFISMKDFQAKVQAIETKKREAQVQEPKANKN
jgi:ribosomal protein L29